MDATKFNDLVTAHGANNVHYVAVGERTWYVNSEAGKPGRYTMTYSTVTGLVTMKCAPEGMPDASPITAYFEIGEITTVAFFDPA